MSFRHRTNPRTIRGKRRKRTNRKKKTVGISTQTVPQTSEGILIFDRFNTQKDAIDPIKDVQKATITFFILCLRHSNQEPRHRSVMSANLLLPKVSTDHKFSIAITQTLRIRVTLPRNRMKVDELPAPDSLQLYSNFRTVCCISQGEEGELNTSSSP